MPNSRSASKRLRSDASKRMRNRIRKSRVRTGERRLQELVTADDMAGAQEALRLCFSLLDKAAKAGSMHKNTVNRKKSRLTACVQRMQEPA